MRGPEIHSQAAVGTCNRTAHGNWAFIRLLSQIRIVEAADHIAEFIAGADF